MGMPETKVLVGLGAAVAVIGAAVVFLGRGAPDPQSSGPVFARPAAPMPASPSPAPNQPP